MYFQVEGLIKRSDLENPTYARFFYLKRLRKKSGPSGQSDLDEYPGADWPYGQ